MSIYAVTYHYIAEPEELSGVRPIHREWLAQQLSEGKLLASGPMVDVPNALLIFKAESLEELSALLDNDPFDIAGFIGERVINQWNPIYGPFVQ